MVNIRDGKARTNHENVTFRPYQDPVIIGFYVNMKGNEIQNNRNKLEE